MKTKPNKSQASYDQEVRIIGGVLKNSKLKFPATDQLRPTPEKLRETLFNWLAHFDALKGVDVLDLFSGTGALGFEALSRGAQQLVLIEKNRQLVANLTFHLNRLIQKDAQRKIQPKKPQTKPDRLQQFQISANYQVHSTDVFHLTLQQRFDLILADPPFTFYKENKAKFLTDLFAILDTHSHSHTFLFLESPFDLHDDITQQCFTWNILRNTRCGQAHGMLLQRTMG
jgi:16S rRNA (guanine966-N2)-methyltransferase